MFLKRFEELASSVRGCVYTIETTLASQEMALEKAYQIISNVQCNQGVVFVIGNGGSAGIASHFSNDLMKALQISSQTLYDTNLLTCLANDIGYENIFSYPLDKYIKKNDALVAISSSGNSPNIVNAAKVAVAKEASVITLTGFQATNKLRPYGHLNFWIDRSDYGLVETAHFFLLHTLVDLWQKRNLSKDIDLCPSR